MTAPRMRAGDPDRQPAVDRLTRNFTEGRLDVAEYDGGSPTPTRRSYVDELTELFVDLPPARPSRVVDADPHLPFDQGRADHWGGPRGRRAGPSWGPPVGTGYGRPQRQQQRFFGFVLLLVVLLAVVFISRGLFLIPIVWVGAWALLSSGMRRR